MRFFRDRVDSIFRISVRDNFQSAIKVAMGIWFLSCTLQSGGDMANEKIGTLLFMASDAGWSVRINSTHLNDYSKSRAISNGPFDVNPSWSVDRQSVYFTRGNAITNSLRIWRARTDGSGLIPVTPAEISCDVANVSFQGNRLVCACKSVAPGSPDRWDLGILDLSTGSFEILTDTVSFPTHSFLYFGWPSFSRDGLRLAFCLVEKRCNWPAVALMDLASKKLIRFQLFDTTSGQCPRFSPTRDEILFCGNNLRLYRMNEDGTALTELDGPLNPSADWSRDGDKIIYEHDELKEGSTRTSFWIINRDGTEKRRVFANPGVDIASPHL